MSYSHPVRKNWVCALCGKNVNWKNSKYRNMDNMKYELCKKCGINQDKEAKK